MKKLTILSLIALIMLGLMSACGDKKEKVQEPAKALNVIYLIGDGMALPQVYAAMFASKEDMIYPY